MRGQAALRPGGRSQSVTQPRIKNRWLIYRSSSTLASAIITICVGPEQRLFAAHEDVLCAAPFFAACCRGQFLESHNKRINLPDEQPEIFSTVLEYLYKGDYYPRLFHSKRRDTWELEDNGMDIDGQSKEATIVPQNSGIAILKETAV
jgi:BTB/POZ domain